MRMQGRGSLGGIRTRQAGTHANVVGCSVLQGICVPVVVFLLLLVILDVFQLMHAHILVSHVDCICVANFFYQFFLRG